MLRVFQAFCVLAAVLVVSAPSAQAGQGPTVPLATFPTAKLSIIASSGEASSGEASSGEASSGRHEFTVEIARTRRQQAQGLMFRRRLAGNAGMLFVYQRVGMVSMWMRNTYIPLDMLFVGADGKIAHIAQRTTPHSLETISSTEPVKSVLELNAGTVARLKIKIGDQVSSPAL